MVHCHILLLNAQVLDRHGKSHADFALAIDEGLILWVGPQENLPEMYRQTAGEIDDCRGQLLTPAWIDCHTHLVFSGHRADEFQLRAQGQSYAEIAQQGGGILSTVRKTRLASEDELIEASLPRLLAMRAEGVLTVEIKSGYGLDFENEMKMLRVARRLGELANIRVMTTFLGAHAIPIEYKGNAQAYVDFLCQELLPQAAKTQLVDAVDVFCEHIGFSLAQTKTVFETAKSLGLPIKCHAEQLSNIGASVLAAEFGALSCDHLEYLDEAGAAALARSNSVAVLLPGAYYFLQETRKPPVDILRQYQVGMAIATDCNPGSSPTTSMSLMMSMACQFFGMSVPEVLSAVTYQAARALGLSSQIGALEAGLQADMLRWPVGDAAELCYYFGYPRSHETMQRGQWITL